MVNQFINPEEILDQVQLQSGMTGAEFGCGSGHWALALARRLNKGLVYAIDVQAETLSALRGQAERTMISNLKVLQRDLTSNEGSRLPNRSLDVILIPNLLSQTEEKEQVLKEAKRVLKPNGFLIIIDWLKKARLTDTQPYISASQVKQMTRKLGLSFLKELSASQSHYALVFQLNNE